jgi:hypothetical protein
MDEGIRLYRLPEIVPARAAPNALQNALKNGVQCGVMHIPNAAKRIPFIRDLFRIVSAMRRISLSSVAFFLRL